MTVFYIGIRVQKGCSEMENETIINQTNLSQAPDQQELIVLENKYKVASVIDFHVGNIIEELKDLTEHFFKLGFHLFKLKEAWSEELTKSEFYKYCEEKFYLKSTSIKNFINVYKSFRSKDDEDEIDERFEGFSFTALVELLPISDDKEFAKSFKKLSTREIREIVAINKENSSDANLLKQVFELMKVLFAKKDVKCDLLGAINEEYELPSLAFTISYSGTTIGLDLDLRKGVSYYGDQEDEVFYLRCKKYISEFDFWSECFGISDLTGVVDKIVKAIKKYSPLKEESDEIDDSKKTVFVQTGAAKRLNLKKKDLIPYVDNPDNYMEDIEIHVSNNDSMFCDFQIRCLRCCDYIWGIFRKPCPDDYGYEDLTEEEKNTYKLHRIINSHFNEINNWEKTDLMLKE